MKIKQSIICILVLIFLVSCAKHQPSSENPNTLSIKIEAKQNEFTSFEDVNFQVYLSNQSDSDVLVHTRLSWMAFPCPSSACELEVLILDSFGKPLNEKGFFVNRDTPSADTLSLLKPEEKIGKIVYLKSGFHENTFEEGHKYTIVVIYHNDINITKTINNLEVPSWVGSIRSNEETFTILP
ncbi:MAG: hypothetical protein HYZ25_15960 [Chloroflexi bacterium]|nr:hypothetical protein [Chloroflexota bacterium]